MPVTRFDHVSLPIERTDEMIAFYEALGFDVVGVDRWRRGEHPLFSISFGDNKINVHPEELVRRARSDPRFLRGPAAAPGCGDLCFVWEGGVDALLALLRETATETIAGPVARVGGRGGGAQLGISVYVRDPDANLLEFISYDPDDVARWGDGSGIGTGARRKE